MERLLINALVETMEEERLLLESQRREFTKSLFRTVYAMEIKYNDLPETLTPVEDKDCPF